MTDRGRVSRLTFVPFLHDGRCALIPVGDRLALPSGEVLPGEDPLLDTGLRVPLVTAGFRRHGLRLMEASYLREPTPQGGSGFGGTAAQWRSSRCQICQAIDRDGTFLDAGCANGHLMESIAAWCAERGVSRETIRLRPFGGPGGRGPTAPAPVGR